MKSINPSKLTLKKIYKKHGFVIIKNFINTETVNKIKKEILVKIKKKNKFFYYEKTLKGLKIRRIENPQPKIIVKTSCLLNLNIIRHINAKKEKT